MIVYTTGKSKGAEVTHFQLYIGCTGGGEQVTSRDHHGLGPAVLPLLHAIGLSELTTLHPLHSRQLTSVGVPDSKILPMAWRDMDDLLHARVGTPATHANDPPFQGA